MKIFYDEGKRVVLSIENDNMLAGTGDRADYHNSTRGEDLYVHQSMAGKKYYYLLFWTRWKGEENEYRVVTEQEARTWVEEHIGKLCKREIEQCLTEEILILEEDA